MLEYGYKNLSLSGIFVALTLGRLMRAFAFIRWESFHKSSDDKRMQKKVYVLRWLYSTLPTYVAIAYICVDVDFAVYKIVLCVTCLLEN